MNPPDVHSEAAAGGSPGEPSGDAPLDFIRTIVAEDRRTGKHGGQVVTRFPPEPNGYLHIGHAKSICLNFGIARENPGGVCHLRFDDTNPETEETRYAEAIQRDVRWFGFDWGDRLFYASDYFERLYELAVRLIQSRKAYVDSLTGDEIREYRGTVTEPGRESPHRNRSVEENLSLFARMRSGEFADGAHVLRAKIDMAAPNMLMRDPVLYRIRHATHYRSGDAWCVYPLYDFTHCLSDSIEGITYSLCTLEFKDNRELYDWVLDATTVECHPQQIEFARLNLAYTVLSKRKLIALVQGKHVRGWDDPRMPTIAGLRRRGVTPEAIQRFCDLIGVARVDSRVDIEKLEYCIRDDLNQKVPRVLGVLRPLRVVITNYPEGRTETLEAPYYPHDVPKEGSRTVPFSRELYIERDDFREDPPKNFFRLAPGREVRLRYAYYIQCADVVKDPESGEIVEIRCTYDPETRGGGAPDGRKVKGTLHWVSATHSLPAEVRLYDRLFRSEDPDEGGADGDLTGNLNPESEIILAGCWIEPSVASDPPGTRYQFERQGFFCSDVEDSSSSALVFNRTVGLRDTWAKVAGKESGVSKTPKRPVPKQARAKPRRRKADARQRLRPTPTGQAADLSRYTEELGLTADQARVLTADLAVAEFFEEALTEHGNPKAIAAWVINDVLRVFKEKRIKVLPVSGGQLGKLVALIDDGVISRPTAKEIFAEMVEGGGDPAEIVERKKLRQVSDVGTLESIVDRLIAAHSDKAEQFRAGRTGMLGFFVGQVMKESGGRANPELVTKIIERKLRGEK